MGQRGAKQNAYNAGYDQAMSERLMTRVKKAEETLKDAINEYSGGDFDGDEELPEFADKYISVPVAEEDPERDAICQDAGIKAVCISAPAEDILKALEEGNE